MKRRHPLTIATLITLGLVTTLAGCVNPPQTSAPISIPPQYQAQLAQTYHSITAAWIDDIDTEHDLARQLMDIAAVNLRRDILLDLDALLDAAGQPDHTLLDSLIEDQSTTNALAAEVWSQHLTRPQAHRILDDHAAAASLSLNIRDRIESHLLSNFSAIAELNRDTMETLNTINARRQAVTRMLMDLQQSLDATILPPAHLASIRALMPIDDQALLYATIAAAIQTIHDTDIRRAAQTVLDTMTAKPTPGTE
ncbi:MAG: hypothetical protein D8M59_05100 [Planctomycetes bacterium]|nr:hypothetical protein [Planctomycetota bacterium]NOG56042.1 hypothetical protein [Planctomycetota bacterium]